jgi:hypothetical protein
MGIFKISAEEKQVQLIYLGGLWVLMSALFIWVCFGDSDVQEVRGKEIVLEHIAQKNNILDEQRLNLKHIDSLNRMLTAYNPENKQVYLESGITYELDELQKAYEKKKDHPHYKVYMQVNNLYSMLYFDKKAIWNSSNNKKFLEKNLASCEVGFQQLQNQIGLQEALKQNQNSNE